MVLGRVYVRDSIAAWQVSVFFVFCFVSHFLAMAWPELELGQRYGLMKVSG
jgi:hypothetical protein